MKWIILLLAIVAPTSQAETKTVITFLGLSNHTVEGVTSGDEPVIELAPGLEVPAYNEENIGLAFGQYRKNTWWKIGRYKNSFFKYSNFLWSGVGVNFYKYQAGMLLIMVDGYPDKGVQGSGGLYVRSGAIMVSGAPGVYFLTFDVAEFEL